MKRLLSVSLAALLTAASLAAQSVPAGWKLREDKSTNAADPDGAGSIKILTAGKGFHVETPTAAVFWLPANTVTGNYTLKGTFTLNKLSTHVNFFGLVFGGSKLEGAEQAYTYFMVNSQTDTGGRGGPKKGAWLIKTRKGDDTMNAGKRVASAVTTYPGLAGQLGGGSVESDAVKLPGADGKSTNTLEVRVQTDKVDFVVNGTVVHSAPRSSVVTDGIWGFRSNHILDINVDELTLTKK